MGMSAKERLKRKGEGDKKRRQQISQVKQAVAEENWKQCERYAARKEKNRNVKILKQVLEKKRRKWRERKRKEAAAKKKAAKDGEDVPHVPAEQTQQSKSI